MPSSATDNRVMVFVDWPGPKSHKNLVSAFDKQLDRWNKTELVTTLTRPLRYQPIETSHGRAIQWRAQEKGVDVLLALDVALGARDDLYDTAVIVSADTDLLPAIDAAVAAGKRVETATWHEPQRPRLHRPLKPAGHRLWNHRLDRNRFDMVRDDTDYLRLDSPPHPKTNKPRHSRTSREGGEQ